MPQGPRQQTRIDRRDFLAAATRWASYGAAIALFPACATEAEPAMTQAGYERAFFNPTLPRALTLPEAPEAGLLFAPFATGEIFKDLLPGDDEEALVAAKNPPNEWSIVKVAHDPAGRVVVLLMDVQSNGYADILVHARGGRVLPLAESKRYAFDQEPCAPEAPPHIRKLAKRLALIVETNEGHVDPGFMVVPRDR